MAYALAARAPRHADRQGVPQRCAGDWGGCGNGKLMCFSKPMLIMLPGTPGSGGGGFNAGDMTDPSTYLAGSFEKWVRTW